MNSLPRWLATSVCSGLLAVSGCFEDPIASTDDDDDEETGNGDGDGDGDPGDGDGDGDGGSGDGDGDGDSGDGDGDGGGDSGDGDGDGDGDGCGPNETTCGGNPVCVNLDIDPANCGECGNPCPPMTLCGEGTCKPEKHVFATDAKYQGNLGAMEGDAICQAAAETASLPPGLYRAWISDADQTPADWFITDGVYRLRGPDGIVVARSWQDLRDGSLENPIHRTEFGEMLAPTPACNNAVPIAVWTGTASDGVFAGPNCNDWSSNQDSAMGRVGNAGATDPMWSASDCTISCATALPIYCVQQ